MAVVHPFCALRPRAELAAEVAALPYDVYSEAEAYEAVQGHPLSFLNIDRAETQFGRNSDPYADAVYRKADAMIREFTEKGIFVREDKPCYYIYALTMDGRTQTGIVGCSSIDDYDAGVIRKHENTRAEKELDRVRHVDITSAQTGPIFLAYRSSRTLSELTARAAAGKPLYDFTSEDGIRHQVWVVDDDGQIEAFGRALSALPCTYIADGHHRAASAVRVGKMRRASHPGFSGSEEFNYFLSVLFPDSELMILPYNRVVRDLNGLSEEAFLRALSGSFTVTPLGREAFSPAHKAQFGMYLSGCWYRLDADPGIIPDDPVGSLDVSILQDNLLSPILGIGDPRTDKRIDFIGGIRGLGGSKNGPTRI